MEKLYKNKDWLYNQYIELGKTMQEIADMCNCSYFTIRYWLIKFDIPIRTKSEARLKRKEKLGYINSPETKKKMSEVMLKRKEKLGYIHSPETRESMSETWEQKYKNGYINPLKDKHRSPESRKKQSETLKQTYKNGYINPLKDKHRSPEIKKKQSETMKQKYENGYINPNKGKFDENAPNWKGDEIGVIPIHTYVRKHKPKPKDGKCELCNKIMDEKGVSKLELSFIDHSKEYTRNPEDYQDAHHSCHMIYDSEHGFLKRNKSIQILINKNLKTNK